MLQQGLALELNQDVDGINARVDQVAEDEIDNPITPAKRDGRFGAFLGERIEPGTFAPGQHKRKHAQLHLDEPPTADRVGEPAKSILAEAGTPPPKRLSKLELFRRRIGRGFSSTMPAAVRTKPLDSFPDGAAAFTLILSADL